MKFIQVPLPPNLPISWIAKSATARSNLLALVNHSDRAEYIKSNHVWTSLKGWLKSISGNKCWYCEAKETRSTLDVDHFRPKLAATVDRVKLPGFEGYYWLSYDWSNYRLSCQRCNRPEIDDLGLGGKANEFAIQNELLRCTSPAGNMFCESPKLLDPCSEDDCKLLCHAIDGEVKPVGSPGSWEYVRARYSIDVFGFNLWNTPEDKRNQWNIISLLIKSANNDPNIRNDLIVELKKRLDGGFEYSSFFRSAIGTYRSEIWINVLL